jgi:hypothetical protein
MGSYPQIALFTDLVATNHIAASFSFALVGDVVLVAHSDVFYVNREQRSA